MTLTRAVSVDQREPKTKWVAAKKITVNMSEYKHANFDVKERQKLEARNKEFDFTMGDVRVYLFTAENYPTENEKLMMQEREEMVQDLLFLNMQEGLGYWV